MFIETHQVFCDAEKRSLTTRVFRRTTPQQKRNGTTIFLDTWNLSFALQNWVNGVYVMVTWYQLFPLFVSHWIYISDTYPTIKRPPKMFFFKACDSIWHVPTFPGPGSWACSSIWLDAATASRASLRRWKKNGLVILLDGKVKIFWTQTFSGIF